MGMGLSLRHNHFQQIYDRLWLPMRKLMKFDISIKIKKWTPNKVVIISKKKMLTLENGNNRLTGK